MSGDGLSPEPHASMEVIFPSPKVIAHKCGNIFVLFFE
jgi:hypothetical protein